MHLHQFGFVFSLDTEVIETGHRAALRDREVDAGTVKHPFRVVALDDGWLGSEQRRIETNAVGEIRHADVRMAEAHQDGCAPDVEQTAAGEQGLPPQQFSVRYASRPFIVAKFAQ